MAIEIVTNWSTLMRLAKAVGNARMRGDANALARAQAEHDTYRDQCLAADKMTLGMRVGDLP